MKGATMKPRKARYLKIVPKYPKLLFLTPKKIAIAFIECGNRCIDHFDLNVNYKSRLQFHDPEIINFIPRLFCRIMVNK